MIDKVFECIEVALELIGLGVLDLPLVLSILMSSERLLTSTELDIAKMLKGKSLFAISLLGTTIQDGGMKERSNVALEYLMFIGLQPILIRTNN